LIPPIEKKKEFELIFGRIAYDDETSTFTVQQGFGFEVLFCPYGRSTNIRQTIAAQQQGSNGSTSGAISGYETPKWFSIWGGSECDKGGGGCRYSNILITVLGGYLAIGLWI
jgi:hypothetical protein